jgi:segregation and condensation protein A
LSIHVQLERFEGPLGLLLHLIREQEMDIFNINIHQITRQYLEYIKTMRRLDLEVAGEFVAMAATLIHIKSRMLLPNYNEEGEELVEDPRKDLVQKLIEYKKFQELSQQLYKLPLLGRDVFRRGERTEIESLEEGELLLEENPLYSLIAAYRVAVKNMKKTFHRVAGEMKSIGERIMEMKEMFIVGRRMVFADLITDKANPGTQVLLTFLSLLELAKMGFISVFQSEPFADIHIDPKRTIDRDVISQVESYDGVNAEQKAMEIMSDAESQLSLEESEIEPEDMAGDTPVVQESFADAASDDDIAAEEMKIAAEDQSEDPALYTEPTPEVEL